MFEGRRYAAKADKDGGGRDEKYEINSMGESVSTVTAGMVAMVSQYTR